MHLRRIERHSRLSKEDPGWNLGATVEFVNDRKNGMFGRDLLPLPFRMQRTHVAVEALQLCVAPEVIDPQEPTTSQIVGQALLLFATELLPTDVAHEEERIVAQVFVD